MQVKVVILTDETGGLWAEVPSLSGCVTQGDTMEELMTNLREAIALYLEPDDDDLPSDGEGRVIEIAV